ncbi:hypothetical protein GCWU000341_02695 [Oribacterium sp. oral taxon 078 str. F0262]|nr:hypothetical protein GCWU000341_02695 [Oribacterium sp. oral taxon 078 str. F0262]
MMSDGSRTAGTAPKGVRFIVWLMPDKERTGGDGRTPCLCCVSIA